MRNPRGRRGPIHDLSCDRHCAHFAALRAETSVRKVPALLHTRPIATHELALSKEDLS